MKKFVLIIIAIMTLVACHNKKVVESQDFNELVVAVQKNVSVDYPNFVFYEAYAKLSKVDSLAQIGKIDPTTLVVVYGKIDEIKTLRVTLDSLYNIHYNVINSAWLEDMHMTPYVPLHVDKAIEILCDAGIIIDAGSPIVLRHQLWFKEAEPRYFIGGIGKFNTVNVYTGEINAPLHQPNNVWFEQYREQLKQTTDSIDVLVESDTVSWAE